VVNTASVSGGPRVSGGLARSSVPIGAQRVRCADRRRVVPAANRRAPRTPRSALASDAAARAGDSFAHRANSGVGLAKPLGGWIDSSSSKSSGFCSPFGPEYRTWLQALPETLQKGATAEALQAITGWSTRKATIPGTKSAPHVTTFALI
jgi:hypothetical protein